MHYCELRDISTSDLIPLHGYGVDSPGNLADTIIDICNNE